MSSSVRVIRGFVFVALVAGCARMAGAQPVHDAAPSRADDHIVADSSGAGPGVDHAPAHLDFLSVADWVKQRRGAREPGVHRWLDAASFRIASARFAARPTAGLRLAGRGINRTFLPIPIVRWQRYSSLLTPRGFFSVNPSIVVGRRMTWAPELARGGRTIGVAVQMRVWFDRPARDAGETIRLQPDSTGEARPKSDPTGMRVRILSVAHSLLDRDMR